MRITVVGAGYVGLVTAVCLAECYDVTVLDVDLDRINGLSQRQVPFYEEGLAELLNSAIDRNSIHFTTLPEVAYLNQDVVFICVPTPQGPHGSTDLTYFTDALTVLAAHIKAHTTVVIKSTVPVGTSDRARAMLAQALTSKHSPLMFSVVSNPEFLREGQSIADFRTPDRVVLGCNEREALTYIEALYAQYFEHIAIKACKTEFELQLHESGIFSHEVPFVLCDNASAELTKYASNAALAARISFMNEIAALCDVTGADVDVVAHGMGLDRRIGPQFLKAGLGYGGSCFPKDVRSLRHQFFENEVLCPSISAIEETNEQMPGYMLDAIVDYFDTRFGPDSIRGANIAIWGTSFKPGTDDMRNAPSLCIISWLLASGANLYIHDPKAGENLKRELESLYGSLGLRKCNVSIVNTPFDVFPTDVAIDALVICTEWPEYQRVVLENLQGYLNEAPVFDGRNIWDRDSIPAALNYRSIGRPWKRK